MTKSRNATKALALAAMCAGIVALPLAANAAGDANKEIMTAAQHAGFAAKSKDLHTVQMHMHHALNCLVGPSGEGFDASQANPCKDSGTGAIADASNHDQMMALEKAANTLRMGLKENDLKSAQKNAMMAQQELKKAEMKKK